MAETKGLTVLVFRIGERLLVDIHAMAENLAQPTISLNEQLGPKCMMCSHPKIISQL